MGNIVPAAEKPADVQAILGLEMQEYLHLSQIGRGKFMKTHLCRRAGRVGGLTGEDVGSTSEKVVIKIYLKRGAGVTFGPGELPRRLILAREQLVLLCHLFKLSVQPSILPYQRFEDNTRSEAAFLTRQHIAYNLYDRLNSRPFPTPIEKLWLIYQLLEACKQAHTAGVRHGDIKAENVMITSWLWLFLTDFATFKPTFIPEDHPADFYYFFETGNRRRCYIAPERFVLEKDLDRLLSSSDTFGGLAGTSTSLQVSDSNNKNTSLNSQTVFTSPVGTGGAPQPVYIWPCDTALTPAMDIFAVGCTICEILLDGEAIFDLSTLLRYRSATGDADPLKDESVMEGFAYSDPTGALRALVSHMIARDPLARGSAADYLKLNTSVIGKGQDNKTQNDHLQSNSITNVQFAPPGSPLPLPGENRIFPAYFPFLFSFGAALLQPDVQSADVRVLSLVTHYSAIICSITGGAIDPFGEKIFSHRLGLEPKHMVEMASFSVTGGVPDPRCVCSSDTEIVCNFCKLHIAARTLGALSQNGRKSTKFSSIYDSIDDWASESVDSTNSASSSSANRRLYSVGVQRALEAARTLRWEWGLVDGGAWGDRFEECDTCTCSRCSTNATSTHGPSNENCLKVAASKNYLTLTSLHEPWIPVRIEHVDVCSKTVSKGNVSVSITSNSTSTTTSAKNTVSTTSGNITSTLSNASGTKSFPRAAGETPFSQRDLAASLAAASSVLTTLLRDAETTNTEDDTTSTQISNDSLFSSMTTALTAVESAAEASKHQLPIRAHPVTLNGNESAGFTLVVTLLTSFIRHVSSPRTKLTALLLLSRFSAYAEDEVKLERVVPYLITLFADALPHVRAHAVIALTSILESVHDFPQADVALFPQYILTAYARLVADPDPLVQQAAAEALPPLALAAKKFVDSVAWKAQISMLQKATEKAAATAASTKKVDISPMDVVTNNVPSSSQSEAQNADEITAPPHHHHHHNSDTNSSPNSFIASGTSSSSATSANPEIFARPNYDFELGGLHRSFQALLQKWLLVGPQTNAPLLVANARVQPLHLPQLSPIGISPNPLLFDPVVVQRLQDSLIQLPASVHSLPLCRRALLLHARSLETFFGRTMTEELLVPLFSTFLTDPFAAAILNVTSASLVPTLLRQVLAGSSNDNNKTSNSITNNTLQIGPSGTPAVTGALVSLVRGWLSRSVVLSGDWTVKVAFLEQLVDTAAAVGPANTLLSIVPFLEQCVADTQEPVVHASLLTITALLRRGLLPRRFAADAARKHASLCLHPSAWHRKGAIFLIAQCWLTLRWPAALVHTADAISPLLRHQKGEEMWLKVANILSKVSASMKTNEHNLILQKLVRTANKAFLPRLRRSVYDVEVDRLVRIAVASAVPGFNSNNGVYTTKLDDEDPSFNDFSDDDNEDDEDDDDEIETNDEHIQVTDTNVDAAIVVHSNTSTNFRLTPYISAVSFAPAFKLQTEADSYRIAALKSYLAATAGPYCISYPASSRLAIRSMETSSSAIHNAESSLTTTLIQRVASGAVVPSLPYPPVELATVPVRSLAVPDQQWASLYPQPAVEAAAPSASPQHEVAGTSGQPLANVCESVSSELPIGSTVHAASASGLPLVAPLRLEKASNKESITDGTLSPLAYIEERAGAALRTTSPWTIIALPPLLHPVVTSAPLARDVSIAIAATRPYGSSSWENDPIRLLATLVEAAGRIGDEQNGNAIEAAKDDGEKKIKTASAAAIAAWVGSGALAALLSSSEVSGAASALISLTNSKNENGTPVASSEFMNALTSLYVIMSRGGTNVSSISRMLLPSATAARRLLTSGGLRLASATRNIVLLINRPGSRMNADSLRKAAQQMRDVAATLLGSGLGAAARPPPANIWLLELAQWAERIATVSESCLPISINQHDSVLTSLYASTRRLRDIWRRSGRKARRSLLRYGIWDPIVSPESIGVPIPSSSTSTFSNVYRNRSDRLLHMVSDKSLCDSDDENNTKHHLANRGISESISMNIRNTNSLLQPQSVLVSGGHSLATSGHIPSSFALLSHSSVSASLHSDRALSSSSGGNASSGRDNASSLTSSSHGAFDSEFDGRMFGSGHRESFHFLDEEEDAETSDIHQPIDDGETDAKEFQTDGTVASLRLDANTTNAATPAVRGRIGGTSSQTNPALVAAQAAASVRRSPAEAAAQFTAAANAALAASEGGWISAKQANWLALANSSGILNPSFSSTFTSSNSLQGASPTNIMSNVSGLTATGALQARYDASVKRRASRGLGSAQLIMFGSNATSIRSKSLSRLSKGAGTVPSNISSGNSGNTANAASTRAGGRNSFSSRTAFGSMSEQAGDELFDGVAGANGSDGNNGLKRRPSLTNNTGVIASSNNSGANRRIAHSQSVYGGLTSGPVTLTPSVGASGAGSATTAWQLDDDSNISNSFNNNFGEPPATAIILDGSFSADTAMAEKNVNQAVAVGAMPLPGAAAAQMVTLSTNVPVTDAMNVNVPAVTSPVTTLSSTSASSNATSNVSSILTISSSLSPTTSGNIGNQNASSTVIKAAYMAALSVRGRDDRDFLSPAATTSLQRRIHALDLPPLPPPLGHIARNSGDATSNAPITAQALRLAVSMTTSDSNSSVMAGVGGGGFGIPLAAVAPPGFTLLLDEAPHPAADLHNQGTTASSLLCLPSSPSENAPPPGAATFATALVVSSAAAAAASSGFELVTAESVSAPSASATASMSTPLASMRNATLAVNAAPPERPSNASAPGMPGTTVVTGVSGLASQISATSGGYSPIVMTEALIPGALTLPTGEDIARPNDVGDGSGYIGAGRLSFLAVERGWRDGLGVGPAPGAPLLATSGTLFDGSSPGVGALGVVSGADSSTSSSASSQSASATSGTTSMVALPSGGGGWVSGITPIAGGGNPTAWEATTNTVAADDAALSAIGSAIAGVANSPTLPFGPSPAVLGSNPSVTNTSATNSTSGTSNSSAWASGDGSWGSRPRGLLLSTLQEHTASITAIAPCGDHSFFATSSDDGTVRIWSSKGLDREVAPSSVLIYRGHIEEVLGGDVERGIRPGHARVLDATVCDNSASVASASAAGSVHVWRVDLPVATRANTSVATTDVSAANTVANSGITLTQSLVDNDETDGTSFLPDGIGAALFSNYQNSTSANTAPSVASSTVHAPTGATLVRRVVFDASEGSAVAVRHFSTSLSSILVAGTASGVIHGVDLRARREAWAARIPPAFGTLTALELVPGATAFIVGTSRGVIALVDTRFDTILCAWRHSARGPVTALYPYVTLDVRAFSRAQDAADACLGLNSEVNEISSTNFGSGYSTFGYIPDGQRFGASAGDGSVPAVPIARQLAVGVACGNDELSFWNLETGVCYRLLRTISQTCQPKDAYFVPYLTRIPLIGGTLAPAGELMLRPKSLEAAIIASRDHALSATSRECLFAASSTSRPLRAVLCPMPTSLVSSLAGAGVSGGLASGLGEAGYLLSSSNSNGSPASTTSTSGDLFSNLFGGSRTSSSSSASAAGNSAVNANGSTSSSSSVGFVLGGLRGAGATRRRDTPFAMSYRMTAGSGLDVPNLTGLARGAGSIAPSGVPPVAFQHGGSTLEGLPVWILTAGTDAQVRCWDLERPRASHTVCGLKPGEVRDGYEAAWLWTEPPSTTKKTVTHSDIDNEEDEEDEYEDEKETDTNAKKEDNSTLTSSLASLQALMDTNTSGSNAITPDGLVRKRSLRNPYIHQYPHPVRACLSQKLYDPSSELHAAGGGAKGGVANPMSQMKGATPSLAAHEASITAMNWLDIPTRLLVTGSADGIVKVWR